jgi:hypothetical protein
VADPRIPQEVGSDTSRDAIRFRTEFLRSLTGEQRAQMAADMTDEVHEISRQGIAARHPEYSPEEVQFAFVRLILGDELFVESSPAAPRLAP